ncbi:uncharacterized protein M421DRAFT_9514 [Didymella exigua CBS 183.55]|uniref:Uncharacterized protein n=1 Tax=Didymella exigua CBS 183.55 TaxID=1150837 RepID=A0A6A5R985_9PLEO|nr:uncharacterized protein M421DRAFT_9514 [Didymella exigua CBS 183.55]KAF1923564.1 hypothetical protein M421DRAFT_9514 [Didymella exigua CBS 183.55]
MLILDKFIALDEDKCHFVYQFMNATGATNVVEAGTSFGKRTVATYKEPQQAAIAHGYWKECGLEEHIDFGVSNLPKTLKDDVPEADLLLLNSARGYKDLLLFLRAPENSFQTTTLPYVNGFEMSVYLPDRQVWGCR